MNELLSAEVLREIGRIKPLLNLKSEGKHPLTADEIERLIEAERQLLPKLALPIHSHFGKGPMSRDAALSFLRAYLFSGLYAKTVGSAESVRSSLPLRTFPLFTPPPVIPKAERLRVFRKLCEKLPIHPDDIDAIERDFETANRKLKQRAELIAALTAPLESGPDGTLTHRSINALFDRLFPGHPLVQGEVDLVATDCGLYFYISSKKGLAEKHSFKSRNAEDRKQVRQYLRRIRDFQFENYNHFPVFGCFDARDADPGLIATLLERFHDAPRESVFETLNSAIMIEETESLEKYLIHDAWGHLWQGDLTDLKRLFVSVAELQFPLSPDCRLAVGDGKVAFTDLLYLNARGECEFDEARAESFIVGMLRERTSWFLAPICAELCADIVEYFYAVDPSAQSERLPTSSVFGHRPAKLDLAWSDMNYYVKALTSPNVRYRKDAALTHNFIERLHALLKLKYPHGYHAVKSPPKLEQRLGQIFARFLDLIDEVQEKRFNMKLNVETGIIRPKINFFFELFQELMRLQATVNRLIQDHIEPHPATLGAQRMVLVFFIVHFFERNPLENFQKLADVVSRNALPFLNLIHECESEK